MVESKILLTIMALIFTILIIFFFTGLLQKGIALMGEGIQILLCGLINWVVQELGIGWKVC